MRRALHFGRYLTTHPLRPHQAAWLKAQRGGGLSEEWFRKMLRDGFDIHHLDGNHENDDPLNLVLIWSGDHMMLHNGKKRFHRVVGKNKGGGRPRKPPTTAAPRSPDMRKVLRELDAQVFGTP